MKILTLLALVLSICGCKTKGTDNQLRDTVFESDSEVLLIWKHRETNHERADEMFCVASCPRHGVVDTIGEHDQDQGLGQQETRQLLSFCQQIGLISASALNDEFGRNSVRRIISSQLSRVGADAADIQALRSATVPFAQCSLPADLPVSTICPLEDAVCNAKKVIDSLVAKVEELNQEEDGDE